MTIAGSARLTAHPDWRSTHRAKTADRRDTLTAADGLPEIDATHGLGVGGSSLAAGLAMILAANDSRVRCVVCQIPSVSDRRNGRVMFNVAQRGELRDRFRVDRVWRALSRR